MLCVVGREKGLLLFASSSDITSMRARAKKGKRDVDKSGMGGGGVGGRVGEEDMSQKFKAALF